MESRQWLILVLVIVPIIKGLPSQQNNRQFVSKARAEYIKQRHKDKMEESIKIPLCTYVEENVEEEEMEAGNQTAFLDPNLGCVSCQMEPVEQCVEKPEKSCQFVADPSCQKCPALLPTPSPINKKQVALNIADPSKRFEKCDGNVSKDKFGRLVVYETKCKKFSSSRCKLAKSFQRRNECEERQICYKKPRLLNGRSAGFENMKCKMDKLSKKKIRLKKVIRRPASEIEDASSLSSVKTCKSDCPKKEVCQNVNVEECHVTQVRICDRLPPEKCQPKIKKRIVLRCTEIAEIPRDLLASLDSA